MIARTSNFIHPTAIIYPNVDIGEGNWIGPYCIIGAAAESRANWGAQGKVIIGNNNRFTGLVTIDGGMDAITRIGDNTFWMKGAHAGHDAEVGDWVTVSCGAKIGGHCHIGDKVNIGLNAVIHQRVIVPDGCMIGASAFVGKKSVLKPYYKYAGVPVKELGPNIKP
jgi:UDP-N-acetylglucosamine acyltransferase